MRYRYLSDTHTHTNCSPDGTDTAMMMCERAVKLGLYALTITDHCECNAYLQDGYDKTSAQSYLETRKAKSKYQGRLKVLTGIELGQPLQDPVAAHCALAAGDFDFVLGSTHNVALKDDFYFLNYDEEDVHRLLDLYLQEELELVEWGEIDSLAHLDYPLRYMTAEHIGQNDLRGYKEQVQAILDALIRKGKALEINTSGLRQVIGRTLPGFDVVKLFHDMGGKYITLGSDAHRWADVAAGIEEGMALAQRAGFTHYTLFENRQPRLIPIE